MLEFYQAYSDYRELMALTEEMLSAVAREAIGTDQVQFGEHPISLAPPYRRVSLREGAARRRRRVSAPTWRPPTSRSTRAAGNSRAVSVSRCSALGGAARLPPRSSSG